MKKNSKLIILLISFITICSGILQVSSPGFVLDFIGAEITHTTKLFFAIIGMFMALFGGMMIQTLYSANRNDAAILWASFQKLGAALAVGLGIYFKIFNWFALSVAVFDLLSGLLFLRYYQAERRAWSNK
jgi:hypothetical protein